MAINIHFFRDNKLEKLDYAKVLEFFDELPNFKIYYTDDEVQIVYRDTDFNFSYRYLITKKSKVEKIYKLNALYSNQKFLLELPVLIPTYIAKEILTGAQKLCKLFDLAIYNDSFDDVKAFSLVDVMALFENARAKHVEEFGLEGKLRFDHEKLNEICSYQRQIYSLKEYYHNEVEVNYCEPVVDKNSRESGVCCTWRAGVPTIFPPHIDYVRVIEEDGNEFLVRRREFFNFMGGMLVEIDNFLHDMYILRPKQAKKSKKALIKLRKVAVIGQNFETLRLCDLIDVEAR